MIKDKKVILLMVVMPLVVNGFICFMMKGDNKTTSFPVAAVIKDKGDQGKLLVDNMIREESNFYKITELSEEQARNKIKEGKFLAAYIISEDFSEKIKRGEKPDISFIKSGNENVAFKLGKYIDEYINREVVSKRLENSIGNVDRNLIDAKPIAVESNEKDNNFDYSRLVLMLVINFVVFSANHVSGELLAQRKTKTLTRQLSTSHKPWEISGGLIVGFGLIQMAAYTCVIIVLKAMFKLQFQVSMLNIFIGVLCMVVVSISIGLFAVRISSNEGIISIIVAVIGTGMGFVSGSFTAAHSMPSALEAISRFTPQYWFIQLTNGGNLIINSLIILLFALVFFTAGSLKFTSFARE
jgi:ABC-2 type transport system permease protein